MTENNDGCLSVGLFEVILLAIMGISLLNAPGINLTPTPEPPDETAITPNTRVIVGPTSPVSDAILEETVLVIDERLNILAANNQISSDFTIVPDTSIAEISVDFAPIDMELDTVIQAITGPGVIELVDFSAVPTDAFANYEGQQIRTTAGDARSGNDTAAIVFPTVITNTEIDVATAFEDTFFETWIIDVQLNETGASKLEAHTTANIGNGLAIVLDGKVLTIPTIQSPLGPGVVISGNFSRAEAQTLAAQLSTVSLPTPLSLLSIDTLNTP